MMYRRLINKRHQRIYLPLSRAWLATEMTLAIQQHYNDIAAVAAAAVVVGTGTVS